MDQRRVLKQQFTFFKHEIYFCLGDINSVFKNLEDNMQDFEFSENIDALATIAEDPLLWQAHHETICQMFFKILHFQLTDNTIANYNMQRKFLLAVIHHTDGKELQKCFQFFQETKVASLESLITAFAQMDSSHILLRYIKILTLYMQRFVVEKKDKFRSKNYLLLVLDILRPMILTLGEVAEKVLLDLITDIIGTFVKYYKDTLTLLDELHHFCKNSTFLRNIVQKEFNRVEATLTESASMCSFHFQSLCIQMSGTDLAAEKDPVCVLWANKYFKAFQTYEDLLYKDKTKIEVEKGDRVLNDSYLFAATEILRLLQERQPDKLVQWHYRLAIFLLQEFSRRSPYNFDLMLRELENNTNLCFFEENHDLFLKHDLKGNQFDTLSYLFFKGVNNIPLTGLAQKYNEKALDFYRECEKESIESFKSCCKHSNLRVLWEFYTYERLNANSVQRIIVDHLMAEAAFCQVSKKAAIGANESQFINAQYLLDYNAKKLLQKDYKIAFNNDLVQIQLPKWVTSKVFNYDLIGPLKDLDHLRILTIINRFLLLLSQGRLETMATVKSLEELRHLVDGLSTEKLKSIDRYHVFRRVNNPLLTLDHQSNMYGQVALTSLITASKLGLELCLEFLTNCLALSFENTTYYGELYKSLGCAKLEQAKKHIDACMTNLILPGGACIDEEQYSALFLLFHRIRMVGLAFSLGGNEIKSNSKKILKDKSESEKETVRTILANYTELKEFFIEKEKQFEKLVKTATAHPALKITELPLPHALELPPAIKAVLPKLIESYNSRFKHALLDSHLRLTTISKCLN